MFHLKAIEIIARSLRGAVENAPEGREGMALGQYVAGMGFSNVGLGIVHSMAHPLGALYDTPHGVANAIILPTVMEYNAPATGEKYREIARAMGVDLSLIHIWLGQQPHRLHGGERQHHAQKSHKDRLHLRKLDEYEYV